MKLIAEELWFQRDLIDLEERRFILRFKSVSKSWNALFQNPNFISKHFKNQSTIPDPSFLFTPTYSPSTSDGKVGFIFSDSSDKSIKIPIEIDFPILKPFSVCGSCNGLICLSVLPIGAIIFLWNPATRVCKDLPISPIDRPPRAVPIKVVIGFGFDDVVKDYKVLRIMYDRYSVDQVEIYSLSTNSWREIKTRVPFLISACSVFLNGKLHWNASGFQEMNGKKLIATFDFREEAFNYIMPPKFDLSRRINGKIDSCSVVMMKESLAMIGSVRIGSRKMFEVWVMKEYGAVSSWMKYRSFELKPKVGKWLGCGLKGEFMFEKDDNELVEKDDNQLVVYDLDSHSQSVINLGNQEVAYCCPKD
ncbi:F-box protein At3g07870-like [Rutidosis leptorrhynchoides]|uniref:F-box protein At3g07870-like n=1 Tax=Rutidosis leptorrhynchoides TaxID=125765 RepID=UPI003A992FDA